jgi:hypothetical protein
MPNNQTPLPPKLTFASNGDDCNAVFDTNGNLIYGWESGSEMSFVFRAICNHYNITYERKTLPEIDGEYPARLQ